jgi:hypothetical protein
MVLSFLAVLIGIGLIARRVSFRLRKRRHPGACDHMLGGLLGAGEGVLLVAVVCWLLASFQAPIESIRARLTSDAPELNRRVVDGLAGINAAVKADPVGRWLNQANPLADLPVVQATELLVDFTTNPDLVLGEEQLQRLAELPEVRRYLQAFESDPEIRGALERGDAAAFLSNPQVRAMFRDRELQRAVLAHRDALRATIDQSDRVCVQSAARESGSETSPAFRARARQVAE